MRLNCGVCYFKLRDISVKHLRVKAVVPDMQTRHYTQRVIPLPAVIHNRAIHLDRKSRRKLAELHKAGIHLYNRHTRYSKWFIHQLLMKNEQLRPHLPETHIATPARIRAMMKRYDSLIIKPSNGSIGRGIMLLQKQSAGWRLRYRSRRPRRRRSVRIKSILPSVLRRAIHRRRYLVQQRIPLATYMDRPFDLRVSVQRDGTGAWQITGIVGKAAPADAYVTNVAQGGTVYTLEHLLHAHPELDPLAVRRDVETLALRVAEHLGHHLTNLADVGLDIGITEQGFPMFIECNCRDLRYSFQEGGLTEEWAAVYHQPISYGRSLLMNLHA